MSVPGYDVGAFSREAPGHVPFAPGMPVSSDAWHGYPSLTAAGGYGGFGYEPFSMADISAGAKTLATDSGIAGGFSSAYSGGIAHKIGLWASYLFFGAAVFATTLWVYGEVKPKDTWPVIKEAKLSNLILLVVFVLGVPIAEFFRGLM